MSPSGEILKRRVAAVLMLVRLIDTVPHLLFIRRSQRVSRHKGQISFPGGSMDATDSSLEQAALREAYEEMGIDPATILVIGSLPAIDTIASNFLIHPFVAIPKDPTAPVIFTPDNFEVGEILEIPLAAILDRATCRVEEWVMRGNPFPASFYTYRNNVIWGATARILDNFIEEVRGGSWPELFELAKPG